MLEGVAMKCWPRRAATPPLKQLQSPSTDSPLAPLNRAASVEALGYEALPFEMGFS